MQNLKLVATFATVVLFAGCSGGGTEPTGSGSEASAPAAADAPAEAAAPAVEIGKKMTTDSGLEYEVLVAGSGASPSATDSVTVHYVGTLTDGTEFDSSIKRGKPATFPLNRVIPGWTEGLQLMQEGAKYRFTIPSDLGYGARGVPGTIPANATLIFEVELLSIN